MRKLIGTWNPTRGMWETGTLDLLSEHSEPFSETWPTWGMTRSGAAFELPTRVPLMDASESSLLRTPVADETGGGPLHPDTAKERGQTLRLTGQILAHTGHLLPTPEAKLATSGPDYARAKRAGSGGDDLTTTVHRLLPTPTVVDMGRGKTVEEWESWTGKMMSKHGNGNGHGASLEIEAQKLSGPASRPRSDDGNDSLVA